MTLSILTSLSAGQLIPYLGPGMLRLVEGGPDVPASPEALVARLTKEVSVPHKIRNNLTAAAQFIENFKHRKTLRRLMEQAFQSSQAPTPLHHLLARLSPPLIVHAWYDDLPRLAFSNTANWGMIQGVSQAEHFGSWVHRYGHDGARTEAPVLPTILYQPFGAVGPAGNFLVSDSDFVEVLTEIDIQTPIPTEVVQLRTARGFLFLGCRFSTQLERIFAGQIIKRSAGPHYALLPDEPTRNELRFLETHGIARINVPLAEFAETLIGQLSPVPV